MAEDEGSSTVEARRERFLRVALRRTNAALQALRLLGNCGNRSAYDYTAAEVEQIFKAVERELAAAKARFRKPEKEQVGFKFE